MNFALKVGEANEIQKGTVFFGEKDAVTCIAVVIKGKAWAVSDYLKIPLPSGSFIGIPDSINGRWLFDYTADEGCVIYPFPVTDMDGVRTMLAENNKDYKGIIVSSLTRTVSEIRKINEKYTGLAENLYPMIDDLRAQYARACRQGGTAANSFPALESVKACSVEKLLDLHEFDYYCELAAIPSQVVKAFYGETTEVVMDHITRTAEATLEIIENTVSLGQYVHDTYSVLYNDGDQNLLNLFVRLSLELDRNGRPDRSLYALCNTIHTTFDRTEQLVTEFMGCARPVNRARLAKVVDSLNTGVELEKTGADTEAEAEDLYRGLKNSLKTILAYAKADPAVSKKFEDDINSFVDLKERLSPNDEERQVRRAVAENFYTIYKAAFYESLNGGTLPKPVELFLNFGFADERLLSKEEAVELCRLKYSTNSDYFCNIFTMYEWLCEIYEGRREPSKNELDMEYDEYLRNRLKNREIDETVRKRLEGDRDEKIDFEINNLFKYANRIVNGRLSTFVPVLCSEQLVGSVRKSLVTKDRIGQLIEKYRELDFGVFRRELLYADKNTGIEKEPVMIEVKQDIILFPCFGGNASMWQDISCKHRDSAGRFLFPILAEDNLELLLVRTLGRFRWELCKTMQGTAWNNIQYKSLTSEYSDYIQYYRKNKDLTDDRKEKIKNQLTKANNKIVDVFAQDYEQWLRYESAGGQKLNKVSRDILSMYCPFSRSVRETLEKQPSFAECIARYNHEAAKKARECDLRIRALAKNKTAVPEIMLDTLKFYKEM